MRRNVLLGLALAALITQNVKAGSAVAPTLPVI